MGTTPEDDGLDEQDQTSEHSASDSCGTRFRTEPYLACGESSMAGSVCTLPAGHSGPPLNHWEL